jgi:hypothetical protein
MDMGPSKPTKIWAELNVYERISTLEDLAKAHMQKEAAEILKCGLSTLQGFCRRYNMIGIWPRGGREGNQNAAITGYSLNAIRTRSRKAVQSSGRDIYTCERCGWKHHMGFALPIHHKDRDRTNNAPNNLEVLCQSCHNNEHSIDRTRGEDGRYIP